MTRTLVAALAVLFTAGAASANHRGVPHVRLTFATIAFNEDQPADPSRPKRKLPGTPQVKTADPLVYAYLQHIARTLEPEVDLQFDIVRGNYYQILHWMRTGEIDGALVSPFIYQILLADSANPERQALGVAEVATEGLADIPGLTDGNAPAFRALHGDQELDDPNAVLARCVAALVTRTAPQCTFQFVSHLSTTGFIYPLARINEILRRDHALDLDDELDETKDTIRQRLLERTRFTLWHKELGGAGTRLEFSYANELYNRRLKSKSPTLIREQNWVPLMPEEAAFAHDVIAISSITTNGGEVRSLLAPLLPEMRSTFTPPPKLERYQEINNVTKATHRAMNAVVEKAFPGVARNAMWIHWYVDENFDFTISELIGLLRNDQIVIGRAEKAALVLPGGGVRGAYQAGMLDELYERYLVNFKAANAGNPHPDKLHVQSVVGTSGGALMGYFAARRAPNDGIQLTNEWVKGDEVRIQLNEVFPSTGAVRCLSILMAVAIFGLFTALLWAKATTGIALGVPAWLNWTLLAVCFLSPLSVFELSKEDRILVPAGAGVIYATLLLLTHAYHSVLAPTGIRATRQTLALAVATIAVGLTGVGHTAVNANVDRVLRELLVAIAGFTMIIAGLFLIAFYLGVRPVWSEVLRYVKGAGTLLAFAIGVLALFSIAVYFEYATSLELTGDYWMVLTAASIIVSAVIASMSAFKTKAGLFFDTGLDFWFRTSRSARVFYTPMLSLLGAGFAALLSWIVFVAPALYDGTHGEDTFKIKARQ